jgi:thioesterase domain-containing protein
VFFIHDGVGEILLYRNLARRLRPGYPVYGIQPVGRNGCPMIHTRWPEMVDRYVGEIRRISARAPLFPGGLSTGGLIALEVARRLKATQPVAMVALFDTAHPSAAARHSVASQRLRRFTAVFSADDDAPLASSRAATKLRAAARKVLNVAAYEARRRADEAWFALRIDLLALAVRSGRRPPRLAQAIAPRLILKRLQETYAPAGRYEGEVILFRASRKDPRLDGTPVGDTPHVDLFADSLLGWEANAARVRVEEVPGGHVSLLMEPHVRTLAERIQGNIERVEVPGDGCAEVASPVPLRARPARS